MKRSQWLFLLCAAVFGLAPSFAWAIPPFQALEFSTVNLGPGTGNTGGQIQFDNTGMIIQNIGGSSFTHQNGDGTSSTVPGFTGFINSIIDGYNTEITGGTAGGQGIVGLNAVAYYGSSVTPPGSGYTIAWDFQSDLEYSSFGGKPLATDGTNDGYLLVRETLVGDSNLDGVVDYTSDYTNGWYANFGSVPNPKGVQGPAVGDYAYNALLNQPNGTVDYPNDYTNGWFPNFGASLPGGSGGPVAAGVAAVPEPSSILLLLSGAIFLGAFAVRKVGSLSMRSVGMLLVTCFSLAFASSASAELVYFLRPVINDTNIKGTEGSYKIYGDGTTTPFSVQITAEPDAGVTDHISFELYAAMLGTTAYNNQGLSQANVAIVNSGSTLAPDTNPADYLPNLSPLPTGTPTGGSLPSEWNGIRQFGTTVGNNWGVTTGTSVTVSSTLIAGIAGTVVNPSSTPVSLITAGSNFSMTPSEISLTGGTFGLVKIADVAFDYTSTSGTLASTLQPIAYTKSNLPSKATQAWQQDGTTNQAWNGNNAGIMTNLLGTSGTLGGILTTQINVTFAGGTPPSLNSGVVDITSGPSFGSLTSIMTGGTATITGVLTNSLTGSNTATTQDAVNWTVAAASSAGSVLNPATLTSASSLTPGDTANLSYNYTAAANFFGVDTVTLTPAGTNATISGNPAAGSQTGAKMATINVLGVTATAGSKLSTGNFVVGQAFGSPTAPLQTQISPNTAANLLGTTASVIGGNATSTSPVTMIWTARPLSQSPELPSFVPGSVPLFSDIVTVDGIGTTTPYVFQMSYSPTALAAGTHYTSGEAAANAGYLYLGYQPTVGGAWVNAAARRLLEPESLPRTMTRATRRLKTLSRLGQPSPALWVTMVSIRKRVRFGLCVNYDAATFAVVPEPGTLALLAAGVAALGFAYRRRKVAKA